MAGDWIKWMKGLSKRREVIVLARKLGISRREAACACMEMWEWADGETANGHIEGATGEDIDRLLDLPGFASALLSSEVTWLSVNSKGITFPRWTRNNGESAKRRANDAAKKRLQRDLGAGHSSRKKRDKRPETVPKKPGPEERRGEESERREEISNRDRTDRPIGADQSGRPPPLGRSRLNFLRRDGEEPFDLSGVDWGAVVALAEDAAKRVPPRTEDDRRAWLKYAVMAEQMFCDDWLLGAAEIVMHAKETKRSRQAHFVEMLQQRAAEASDGTDPETFNAIARRIEIPDHIWQSDVIGGPK